MKIYEYCAVIAVADRPAQPDATWSIVVNSPGLQPEIIHRSTQEKFAHVFWLNAMGLRRWDIVDTIIERATFPGTAVGLDSGNRISFPSSYRLIFRRLVERSPTEAEIRVLNDLGL